jgi:hypothetical protein
MAWRPVAGRGHTDLARMRLGVGDELGNCLGWKRWIYHHDKGRAGNACDRRDVADEIEVERVVERRIDRVRRDDQKERIAVRGCTHDRLGGDIGAGAWPVLDDELLAEPLRQPLTHQTRDEINRAARGKAHDHAHRPRRICYLAEIVERESRSPLRGSGRPYERLQFHRAGDRVWDRAAGGLNFKWA